jgi:hypothetical protein
LGRPTITIRVSSLDILELHLCDGAVTIIGEIDMSAEADRVESGCRLCNSPLHSFELRRRLCTICEGYAEQLGVRDEAEFEKVVLELMSTDPFFRPQPRSTV